MRDRNQGEGRENQPAHFIGELEITKRVRRETIQECCQVIAKLRRVASSEKELEVLRRCYDAIGKRAFFEKGEPTR